MTTKEKQKNRNEWHLEMESEQTFRTWHSVDNTIIYPYDENIECLPPRYESTIIKIKDIDAATAITWYHDCYPEENLCVLDFASYLKPGGGFLTGANSQEEMLCMRSNLYSILKRKPEFYKNNKKLKNNGLYTDNCMYIPDVYFRNEYDVVSECNVIVCAAPNAKVAIKKFGSIKFGYLTDVMNARIKKILKIARLNEVDNLILGAFGCGAFGNSPDLTATLFFSALFNRFYGSFKRVIFAIPGGKNLEAFDTAYNNYSKMNDWRV